MYVNNVIMLEPLEDGHSKNWSMFSVIPYQNADSIYDLPTATNFSCVHPLVKSH